MRMPDLESPVANPADIDVSPAEPKVPEAGQGQVSGGEGVPDWLRSFSLEDPTVPAPELEAPIAAEDTLVEEAPAESLATPEDVEAEAAEEPEPQPVSAAPEPVEKPAEEVQEVEEAGDFAGGVKKAGRMAKAASNAVEKLRRDLSEKKLLEGDYRKNKWEPEGPEKGEKTVAMMKAALDQVETSGFTETAGLELALKELREQVDEQDGYREMREYAEELTAQDLRGLRKALKELTPGVFNRESDLQREMVELSEFFARMGDLDGQREEVAEWEALITMNSMVMRLLDDKKLRVEEARIEEIRGKIAAQDTLEGLLACKDMPEILRAVIETEQAGAGHDFGEGPIGDFKRKFYEDILGALGVGPKGGALSEVIPAGGSVAELAGQAQVEALSAEEEGQTPVEAPEVEEVLAPVEAPVIEVVADEDGAEGPVEIEAAAETPEQRFEIRKQEFAGALAELDKAKGDTNGTEDEQKVRLAEAFNQVIGAAMEFMEEGDNAKEVVREFLSGALGTDGGKKLTEVAVRSRMDEVGVFQASTPEEKKKKLKEAGLWGLLTLLLELGMSFTDKAVKAVVSEVQSATGGGR